MTQTSQPLRLTSAFEPYVIGLLRDMEADGWTGKVSKRGHAIMRAPDGVTTCSVAPKVGAPQDRKNLGAAYRAWKKEQEVSAAAAETDSAVCPDCHKPFPSAGRMRIHFAHAHVRVTCPLCPKQTSPAQAPRHLASHFREADSTGQLRRDLARANDEIARLREEVLSWQQLAQEAIDLL